MLTIVLEATSDILSLPGSLALQQKQNVFLTDLLKAGITIMYTKGLTKQLKDVPHWDKA